MHTCTVPLSSQVVLRYVKVSAQLLAPITPHTSEHVWINILKQAGSVLNSGWPAHETPDFVMQRAAKYIEVGQQSTLRWGVPPSVPVSSYMCAANNVKRMHASVHVLVCVSE